MLVRLARAAFNLNEGEGRKVLEFALLGALLQGALAIGISAADSVFLARVGADKLPIIYLLTPLVMLTYIPLYSFCLTRYGIDRLFDITLSLLVIGGAAIAVGMAVSASSPSGLDTGLIYAVKLYAVLWYIALYSLYWNFSDGYFDILDAKRLYALLAAGAAFGASLGGALVTFLAGIAEVEVLFLAWALLSLITLPLLIRIRRKWKRLDSSESHTDEKAGIVTQTKRVLKTFGASKFAAVFTTVLFCTMVVTLICEFQYMAVFAKNYSESELAGLFGQLFFFANLGNLIITLFLFNRMVARFGIRNVALVQPIVYSLTFVFFLLENNIAAGMVGFFAYHGILTAVDYNNSNLLFNALPSEGKKQLRTFIEGICEPAANLLAGTLLLVFATQLSPAQISAAGLGAALFCLVMVLLMRPAYVEAMISNLRHNWLDFSLSMPSILQRFSTKDLEFLRTNTGVKQSQSSQIAAVQILMNHDPAQGSRALFTLLEGVEGPVPKPVRELIEALCHTSRVEVIKDVLDWLESARRKLAPTVLEQFALHGLISMPEGRNLLGSQSTATKLIGVAALRHSGEFKELIQAIQVLNALLAEGTIEKAAAVRALGYFAFENQVHLLLPYLQDTDAEVRKEALIGLRYCVSKSSSRIVPDLLEIVRAGSLEDSLHAIDCLTQIGDVGSIPALLALADQLRPAERRKVERLINEIGLSGIPTLIAILRDESATPRARSIAARAMAHLSFAQLESMVGELIEREVRRAYDHHAAEWTLRSESQSSLSGLKVLAALFREQRESVIEFVLELLALSGKLPDFELLLIALQSDNKKERGNAIETIQQACSGQINRLLLPLVDSRSDEERREFYRATFQQEEISLETLLDRALASNDPLQVIAAAQAYADQRLPNAQQKVCTAVRSHIASKVRGQLIDLAERIKCTGDTSIVSHTSTEKVAHLLSNSFFNRFRIAELFELVEQSTVRIIDSDTDLYATADSARKVFYVLTGKVLGGVNGEHSYTSGQIIGGETLYGASRSHSSVRSRSAIVLEIPRDAISDLAEGNWRAATGMVHLKLQVTEGRQ